MKLSATNDIESYAAAIVEPPRQDLSAHDGAAADHFAAAKQYLALAQSFSTCKKNATTKLLTSCERLQKSAVGEVEIELLQDFYAAHLAVCELETAYPKLSAQCGMQLPAYAEDALEFLEIGGGLQLKRCINVLKSQNNYWTSYSNNRRDSYMVCKAMSTGFDDGELLLKVRRDC